jgi:hypothetical protein
LGYKTPPNYPFPLTYISGLRTRPSKCRKTHLYQIWSRLDHFYESYRVNRHIYIYTGCLVISVKKLNVLNYRVIVTKWHIFGFPYSHGKVIIKIKFVLIIALPYIKWLQLHFKLLFHGYYYHFQILHKISLRDKTKLLGLNILITTLYCGFKVWIRNCWQKSNNILGIIAVLNWPVGNVKYY